MEFSVIVPNWNGGDWIARCLSSLQNSARAAGGAGEIIVVDDASADGSPTLIRERFPRLRLLSNPRNIGFARSINRGAKGARGRILILCNNDLAVREEFVGALLHWFRNPEERAALTGGRPLFAVSAKTVGWYDGKPNQLRMGALWRGGRITPAWDDSPAAAPCLFVQAGAAAYDSTLFWRLGGLSTLYEPGYWEDYDLSWRAAKCRWAQLYEPRAFALHYGGGSMSKRYGAAGVARMKSRNHLLFEAANLRSPRLIAEWCARAPAHLARSFYAGNPPESYLCGGAAAAKQIRGIIEARFRFPGNISDEEVLKPWKTFQPSY